MWLRGGGWARREKESVSHDFRDVNVEVELPRDVILVYFYVEDGFTRSAWNMVQNRHDYRWRIIL